jgi:hypothetical protein
MPVPVPVSVSVSVSLSVSVSVHVTLPVPASMCVSVYLRNFIRVDELLDFFPLFLETQHTLRQVQAGFRD